MIRAFALTMVAVGILAGLLRGDPPVTPPAKEFVVHEWAVWVKGKDADGKTVLGSPAELAAGLPKFVQTVKEPHQVQPMQWLKPVLHLYGDEGLDVHVKVTTDQGVLSSYWPAGKALTRVTRTGGPRNGGQVVTDTMGMEWSGTLHAKPEGQLGEAPKDHWWSAVRDVPSMYLAADKQCERFLFYEGTALQEPTVAAKISADQLKLANSGGDPAGQVMVIVNSGDKRYCRVLDEIKAGGDATISKAEFLAKEFTEDHLLFACRAHWQQSGMTQAEAKAIVRSWRPDLLRPWQILVISRMPADLFSYQDEKSQIKNREKGMRVLRSRLYEVEMQKQADALAKERKQMVGSGDRSEKIRTYNFPQNRLTDHRIGFTIHQLEQVMDGKLQPIIDALISHYQAENMKAETAGVV